MLYFSIMAIPVSNILLETEPAEVILVVEGQDDREIVAGLLAAAGYPLERIRLLVGGEKHAAVRMAASLATSAPSHCAALLNFDEIHVPDARAWARNQFGDPSVEIFCALPATEAWLFADDQAVLENAVPNEEVQRIVQRLPLPEEIPDPEQLAHRVFGPALKWGFLRQVDVGRAAARSPSLRVFLEGMARLLEVPAVPLLDGVSRNLSRDIIAGLLREVSPADAVVWRTMEGDEYTASELHRHIESGDEIGRQYTSDLLRISRDFLRRAAGRSKLR